MKIGIDIRPLLTPVFTGVAVYTEGLLNALFEIDKKNQYVLFYNDIGRFQPSVPGWRQDNVHFARMKLPSKLLNSGMALFGWPKVDRRMKNLELGIQDIDYFFSPNPNFLALSSGVRHILIIHDLSFELFPECYSWKRRWWHTVVNPRRQCERAHVILTPSENTKRDVMRVYGIEEKKIHVIRPGIPSTEERLEIKEIEAMKKLEICQKYHVPERFLLFLGTIEPRKNIIGLLDAYRLYAARQKEPIGLVIAGPLGWKYSPILHAIQKTAGARYIGAVSDEEKSALYRSAQVFIYPSVYEGFGFPVLEAFVCGTPVIASNRSSLPEIAGDAAYLVHPRDAEDMARAMTRVAHDEGTRVTLIGRGLERARLYSWRAMADAWLSAVSSVS